MNTPVSHTSKDRWYIRDVPEEIRCGVKALAGLQGRTVSSLAVEAFADICQKYGFPVPAKDDIESAGSREARKG